MSGHSNEVGFSLVEIIIVMAMIAVLSTITVLNFKGNSITDRLTATANTLQSTLTLARTYARTGKVCCGNQTPNGYGVYVNTQVFPNQIVLYGNIDTDFQYTQTSDVIVSTTLFDDQVVYNDASIRDVLFMTGTDNSIIFEGEGWEVTAANTSFTLQDKNSGTITTTVTLHYPSGLIDQP